MLYAVMERYHLQFFFFSLCISFFADLVPLVYPWRFAAGLCLLDFGLPWMWHFVSMGSLSFNALLGDLYTCRWLSLRPWTISRRCIETTILNLTFPSVVSCHILPLYLALLRPTTLCINHSADSLTQTCILTWCPCSWWYRWRHAFLLRFES